MKKSYIAPSTGVYNINAATIMATSGGQTLSIFGDETTVDTSTSTNQLGREDNAVSNVWDSEW